MIEARVQRYVEAILKRRIVQGGEEHRALAALGTVEIRALIEWSKKS